jgi:protoheme IX farnesyltransferase
MGQKIKAYTELMKLRLSSLVIYSAVLGYMIAPGEIDYVVLIWLSIGGAFVTGASNAFNQIIERDLDKIMDRTKNRPLPSGRLTVNEALIFSIVVGGIGVGALFMINGLCAWLGLLAMVLYVLTYTPLKTKTPLSVFVGAIPGSFPPMLGYVAATASFGLEAGVLFAVQFFWQFPHFWAIAWKLNDDYLKAGFKMLPSLGGRDKKSAFQILIYTAMMLPMGAAPYLIGMSNVYSVPLSVVLLLPMLIASVRLYLTLDMQFAKKVMFASFYYLPLIQIIYLVTKI